MKARDVMATRVVTVTGDTPVREVATIMLSHKISGIPVVDSNGRLEGVVSEGDLVRRAELGTTARPRSWWLSLVESGDSAARDYIKTHGLRADEVMTRSVVSIAPDAELSEIAMTLEKNHIKRVPVVQDDVLVGIVSRADLLRALAARAPDATAPGDVDDATIRRDLVAHLMAQPWGQGAIFNIVVSGGVVHLWGTVASDDEREAMMLAARSAPGVTSVQDHLVAEPVT